MKSLTFLVIFLAVPVLGASAQGIAPNGAVFGDGRDFSQDLTRPGAPPGRPSARSTERDRRAERRRQANQNFPGTGRPVAAPPVATPAIGQPARPIAPTRPQAEPTGPSPERRAATAAPPPSPRTAPVAIQPGQSTGAARGAPASR